jgi:hypothetical protein
MFSSARMMKPWIETQHIEGETPVSGFWHPKPTKNSLRTVNFSLFHGAILGWISNLFLTSSTVPHACLFQAYKCTPISLFMVNPPSRSNNFDQPRKKNDGSKIKISL